MGDVTQPASGSEPRLTAPADAAVLRPPRISVIVPARDEECCLRTCLNSLVTQTGVSFKVIVVNDGSTDRTGEIASEFAQAYKNVQVIVPPALTEGWIGKNNACAAGAAVACGQWLLFTDADTFHQPGSLAAALTEAESKRVGLLSYSPAQEVHGFWQRAVMPVVFAELATAYSPRQVSDPASPQAAANGQYVFIRRDVYDEIGGHQAVAGELLEDVALARRVKAAGHAILFRNAHEAVRTRMYSSFAQMKEGWTKNLVLLFPAAGRLAWRRAAEFATISSGLVCAALAATLGWWDLAAASLTIALFTYVRFLHRIRRAEFPWISNWLAIFGLPVFVQLLRRSAIQWKGAGITWKGRRYGPPAATGR